MMTPLFLQQTDSTPYGYKAMFCLPRNHHQLQNWTGAYSIYHNFGEWRHVRNYLAIYIATYNDIAIV